MALVRLLTRTKWRLALLVGIIGIAGIGGGLTLSAAAPTSQGGGRSTPPQAFKSGGQLSVPVLREIADTLERIDTRIQRIEQAVLSAANKEQPSQRESQDRR